VAESQIDLGLTGIVRIAMAAEVLGSITLQAAITDTHVAMRHLKMTRRQPWQRGRSRPGGSGARLVTTLTVG
jgi:hypothetical protein